MAHRKGRARLGLLGAFATVPAVVAATVAFQSPALGSTPAAAANVAAPTSTVPAWTGNFDNFHTSGWNSSWGLTSDSQQCQGASGSFSCNWGYGNMQAVSDSTAPGGGQALKVTYPADSGPPSCFLSVSGCVLGGGQFYQDLTTNGQSALAQSPSLDLKYSYNFPVGFDFGKKTAGKMPGLWGGGVPGCESGGQHCAQGWSTRYMWRGGSSSAPNGEVYFYTASGSGFGADLCLGNWTFPADGKWHSIEQLVNIQTGSITVWSDGKNVCQQTEPMPGAFSGVFFSTFHGGHDTTWSPSHTTTDEFADFSLSTDGPQTATATSPATPANVTATAAGDSSIALSWSEADNGDPAASYKVYEGTNVVATATGTSATITGLAPGSTHTFTVTAVDASGVESSHSASATATTSTSTTRPATPTGLTVTGTTSTSVSLSWTETNNADPAASYAVYEGSTAVATSTTTGATITGLTPGSTHTYTVAAVDAAGNQSAVSAPVTATTQGGTTPAVPTGLTVSTTTSSSVSLSWSENNNSDPAASYRVYEGTSIVATSTTPGATIGGLAAGSSHSYTVTAVDSAGGESGHSAAITATTSGGGGTLSVSLAKTKDWGSGYTETGTLTNTSGSSITGWNVQFDLDATENIESSAGVSYSCSAHHCTLTNLGSDATIAAGASLTFQFSGDYPDGGHFIAPTNVAAFALGAQLGPATPTGLTVTGTTNSSISLSWAENSNSDPAASYKVSEGGTVVATVATTSATITGLTPGSTHTYAVTAVDAAGNGSGQSAPITATTQNNTVVPAVPTGLTVTGTTNSSISLSWSENDNGDPAASYRVYEGSNVVTTSSTTTAAVSGLAPNTTHTYTVTAVDAAGAESPGHSNTATGTTTGTNNPGFSQSLIDSAVAAPPFAWAAPTLSVPRPGTNPVNIGEAKVVYYLAVVDKLDPAARATNGTTVDSALLAQVRSMISGGKEPDADGGLEMWGQAPVGQALLLLKNGQAWGELTPAEQNKINLLEAAMGYGSNYTYNDANSFSSGICGFGNFSKTNNPNYRDGGVDSEIAAIEYYGASTWDSMLSSFDDATFTAQLQAAGLTNAAQCFAAVGSGGNSAIRHPFVYQGHASSDLMGIWSTIAGNTFDKTAASTVGVAHIADGTTSPYDGQCCMGHEFDSTDSSGLRSSALYVFEGWMNVTGSRVSMLTLGNFSTSNGSESAYHTGTGDLKYKLDHGYISQGLNQNQLLVDDHGDPATDGPNVKGFLYDWDAYTVAGTPAS